ncbi:MAG: hypothetical protein MMC33_009517, partial [Icmadophila ericetorum]|nr:hypothetical protein [Icmadophila ericetorum]
LASGINYVTFTYYRTYMAAMVKRVVQYILTLNELSRITAKLPKWGATASQEIELNQGSE